MLVPTNVSFGSRCGSRWIWNGGAPACTKVEVKPESPPQNTPPSALGLLASVGILRSQPLSTNATPMIATARRTATSDTCAANTQAAATPITAPGSITLRFQPLHV